MSRRLIRWFLLIALAVVIFTLMSGARYLDAGIHENNFLYFNGSAASMVLHRPHASTSGGFLGRISSLIGKSSAHHPTDK